ncbi:MAG: hypothetical protein MOB07_25720 [Acidobacteria bacterium]|nr:hypothetical protein [Acidobacteriota bacterium]
MHAAQAIHYLTRRLVSPDQAVSRLSFLHEAAGMLKIYRHFFPDEFAACNLKPISGIDDLHAALAGCLRLVSERLFEIPDYFFDGLTCEDLPLSYVPIEPVFGEWRDAEIEDLMPLWQVLLILLGEVEPDDPEDEMIRAALGARRQWRDQGIDCDKLARLCRRRGEPLCWLHLALLTIDLSAGNPWLDASYECPILGIEWTVSNVNYLRKKWLEANHACDHILSLNKWLGEDAANIHRLLDLWSRALAPRLCSHNQPS